MKRLSQHLLLLMLLGVLFGCSLAKAKEPDKKDDEKIEDELLNEVLLGYWLTFEGAQSEEFSIENDLVLMEYNYILGKEKTTKYIHTDGILNLGMQNKTETTGPVDNKVTTLKSLTLEANVILAKNPDVVVYAYPIFKNQKTGDFVLGSPTAYSFKIDDVKVSLAMSQSQTVNQVKEEINVKINVSMVDVLEYVEMVEFDEAHQELRTTAITEDKSLNFDVLAATDYIIIKEIYKKNDVLYTKRILFNRSDQIRSDQRYNLNFSQAKGFVIGNKIVLNWGNAS